MGLRRSTRAVVVCFTLLIGAATIMTPVSAAAAAVKRGGTFTFVDNGGSWLSLDPQQSSSVAVLTLFKPMFEGLFTYNAKNQLEPWLATGASYSANRLTVTITLRKGVKFQDGTPFNASAVAFDLMRMASPGVDSECTPYFDTLTSANAVGPYKVAVHFSAPYGPFLSILGGDACGLIGSPTAIQSEGAAGFGLHPVGTGPYKFVSEVPDSTITWGRFPGYWQKGQPYYNTVVMNTVGSDTACYEAVQAGTAQMCAGDRASDIPAVSAIHSIRTVLEQPVSVDNIRLNVTKPPFNNIWARRALANAINVTELSRSLYGRWSQPTESYEGPTCFCFTGNRVRGYPQYNVAAAQADVAKLPGGSLSFQLSIENTTSGIQEAEAVASFLQPAHINVTITPLTPAVLFGSFHKLTYQAGLTTTFFFPDPDDMYYRNFDSTSAGNQVGLNDPLIDSVTTQARETVSAPQRKALYARVQMQLAQDLPLIALLRVYVPFFVSKSVQGVSVAGSGDINFANVAPA